MRPYGTTYRNQILQINMCLKKYCLLNLITYLGSDMHSSERSTPEILRRIGLASNIFSRLTNILYTNFDRVASYTVSLTTPSSVILNLMPITSSLSNNTPNIEFRQQDCRRRDNVTRRNVQMPRFSSVCKVSCNSTC